MMKKTVCLLCALAVLMGMAAGVHAEEETALERYTRLLTEYTWVLDRPMGLSQTGAGANFAQCLTTIHLPMEGLYLVGDETGNVYILYASGKAGSAEARNTVYPGKICFNADCTVMVILVDNTFCSNSYLYFRQ